MMSVYLLVGFLTSLLGLLLLLLSQLHGGKRKICVTNDSTTSGGTDVIVVGAGVAGSALAYKLGKDGRRVRVIERDLTEPNTIAGEALLPGGYLKLIQLGLEDCVEEIDAQRLLGFVFAKDGKNTMLPFPLEKYHTDVAGRGFHHGRFIQRMHQKAASLQNVQLEQGTVTTLLEENGTVKGVSYKTKSGEEHKAFAPLTVVCDGYFSNLRRSICSPKIDVHSRFVGLVLENRQVSLPNHGRVILGLPSPTILYPISSTEVRCLVDIPGEKMPSIANGEMANYLKSVVGPQIPHEIYDAFISAINGGSMRTMKNISMPASPYLIPGTLLLGDAFNVRHPITGGGMTVALSDVALLCNLLKPLPNLHNASALCRYLQSFYTLRKPVSSIINILAATMHKVFGASPHKVNNELGEVFFGYLSLGGVFTNGFAALISGLNPRPLSLVFHFFSMVVYGIGRLLLPMPSPKRLWLGARLISDAFDIIFPLFKAEGVHGMFFPATIPALYGDPPTH